MEKEKVKKPIYKKWWFILIIAFIIIGAISSQGDKGSSTASSTTEKQETKPDAKKEEPKSYEQVEASTLIKILEGNALKAKNTYKDKYVEITGYLGTVDASGNYISIDPEEDAMIITGIQAYTTNDEQKKVIAELSKNKKITIKGKIKDVGELIGYSVDIDEIVK